MQFQDVFQKKHLIFDGGFGTMLLAAGLPAGASPDQCRITSYNVCYTKLLRSVYVQVGRQHGNEDRVRSARIVSQIFTVESCGRVYHRVITSYSIHYTKLYDRLRRRDRLGVATLGVRITSGLQTLLGPSPQLGFRDLL